MKIILLILALIQSDAAYAFSVQYQSLLNSGSKTMAVNGGTPKTFSYSPGGSLTVRVKSINMLLEKSAASPFNKFGSLTSLTNGVLIQLVQGGTTTTYATLKDNADLTNAFPDEQHYGNSAVLSILGIGTPQGFGNTNNMIKGKILFHIEVLLTGSDSINAIVQDNLSTLGTFEMGAMIEQD